MSVKYEKLLQTKISGKGIFLGIDENGISVEDEKEGTIDVVSLDEINALLKGKSFRFSFGSKEADEE